MDKKDWEDIVKEPMSESLKARTLARARQELETIRDTQTRFQWAWLIPLIPVFGALMLFIRQRQDSVTGNPQLAELDYLQQWMELSDEQLQDLDNELLADLELLEDLEILEEWDGTTTES